MSSELNRNYPTLGEIDAAIAARQAIYQAKLNHGFWENWMAVEQRVEQEGQTARAELDRAIRRWCFTEGGFLEELSAELEEWPTPPAGPYLSCSSQAFPDDDYLAPLPPTPRDRIDRFIQRKAPSFSVGVDGLVWKRAVLNGSICEFMQALRANRVVMVGPAHLEVHRKCWDWRNFEMIAIHPAKARGERTRILEKVVAAVADADFPVVLLQCGSMSVWMVAKLFRLGIRAAVLDPGRALDFVDPEVILAQPWGAVHTETLARNFCPRIPAWSEWRTRIGAPAPAPVPRRLVETHAPAIQFVERKSVDFDQLEMDLAASARTGHWANRGPAVESLESGIAERLRLDEDVVPVVVSSGTAALWVAAAVAELRHGAPIRWVVSSFGFFSSAVGPLTNARIVDCDQFGMLSLETLDELEPDSFDGIVVTDLFGRANVQPYLDFAERCGKKLVIDAAAGFDRALYRELPVPVAFSFHHTKSFGFGEGGCVLMLRREVAHARSIANFGHDLPRFVAPFCGNWKMSDLQAAMIAQRHSTAPYWTPQYRLQYARVRQIAKRQGIRIFPAAGEVLRVNEVATPSYIALLLAGAVSQQTLDRADLPFVARKYYRPLKPTKVATELYSRIVCIPVHKDMAALDSKQIAAGLECIVTLQERQS